MHVQEERPQKVEGSRHGHAHEGHAHEHFGPSDPVALATQAGVRATWISLGALLLTAFVQLAVVAASGSVALFADTIHNFTDALTAVPLLIAFRLSQRPASPRFPYGYHRAEDLAGLLIVAMIVISALLAAAEAVRRLVDPQSLDHVGWVLAAGVIGALGNEAVAVYRIRVGRTIGSAALEADGLHARTDGLASIGVVASALVVMAGFERADPLVGLAITVLIMLTLVRAAQAVGRRIMDATDEQTMTVIEEIASSVEGVEHVTRALARWTGHRLLAELDIQVDARASLIEAHAIAESVESELCHHVPRLASATVHVDPHMHPDR